MIVPYPFFLTEWIKPSSRETVWKVAVRVEWHVLWQREAPKKVPFRTVVQAKGTTKWSPFGLSRQSLEGKFCEVRVGFRRVPSLAAVERANPHQPGAGGRRTRRCCSTSAPRPTIWSFWTTTSALGRPSGRICRG